MFSALLYTVLRKAEIITKQYKNSLIIYGGRLHELNNVEMRR